MQNSCTTSLWNVGYWSERSESSQHSEAAYWVLPDHLVHVNGWRHLQGSVHEVQWQSIQWPERACSERCSGPDSSSHVWIFGIMQWRFSCRALSLTAKSSMGGTSSPQNFIISTCLLILCLIPIGVFKGVANKDLEIWQRQLNGISAVIDSNALYCTFWSS
jgi:hypothetical protein